MSSCVFVFFPSFFCERLFSILCFLSSLRLFSVLPRWFPDPVFWMCFSLHASRRPGLDFVKILLLLLVPRLCYLDFTFSFVKAHILLRFPACLCVFHLQTYRMLVMKTVTYISYILLFDTKLGWEMHDCDTEKKPFWYDRGRGKEAVHQILLCLIKTEEKNEAHCRGDDGWIERAAERRNPIVKWILLVLVVNGVWCVCRCVSIRWVVLKLTE